MKRTSKKRRSPRLTLRRIIRATWRFPLFIIAGVLSEPIVWLVLMASLLYRFGIPTLLPSLVR